MKKTKIFLLLLTVLSLLIVGTIGLWWKKNTSAVSTDTSKIRFVIPKGKSASQVGIMLEEKGLIKNSLAFKIYVQMTDKQDAINAGEFSLSPSMDLVEIIDAFGKEPELLWVTIPEGLRKEQFPLIIMDDLEGSNFSYQEFSFAHVRRPTLPIRKPLNEFRSQRYPIIYRNPLNHF